MNTRCTWGYRLARLTEERPLRIGTPGPKGADDERAVAQSGYKRPVVGGGTIIRNRDMAHVFFGLRQGGHNLLCPIRSSFKLALLQWTFDPLDEKAFGRQRQFAALFYQSIRDRLGGITE